MKLIEKPRVVLVSRPVIEIDGISAFLREHGLEWPAFQEKLDSDMDLGDRDGEWIAEAAGRVCYMSFGKGRSHEEYLKHIIEVGHGSVLEHANYGFLVWGVSRSLTHELVRHRPGMSYSQLSQRYVDASETAFIVPPAMQTARQADPPVFNEWLTQVVAAQRVYRDLTERIGRMYGDIADGFERRKKARQASRSVLPNATETKIWVGGNVRAIRHLVEMRAHPAADLEIRRFGVEVFRIMQKEAPLFFHDMRIVALPDGTEGVESDHRKV